VSENLNPLSYVILGLVGRGGAGAHDIVDMMRRGGRLHWAAAPSKIYSEPKRLAALGLLDAREEAGRTRPRTVYTLTPAGERALAEWIARPSAFPRIQSEAVARLMAGDIGDPDDVRDSLLAMRGEIAELRGALAESREAAAALPHRTPYLRLVGSLGRRILDAHEEWLDEVERELGPARAREAPAPAPGEAAG
jgi:DNA-binding PadR family transcriptional regulator